jgi:hypothetical protein
MVKLEGQIIRDKLTQTWPNGETFKLETELIINTVTFAILNPSKYFTVTDVQISK